MYHVFRGKRYRIRWVPRLGKKDAPIYGDSDDPRVPANGKEIRIQQGLPEDELLYTLIHEALHLCYPDADEDSVEETAKDIGRLLRKLGWQRV